jgi:hypothetical protein
MLHRPSLRATVTTLAAAAVLVGGAQLTSYAATGHPLLIGKSNSGVGTTTLKNAGRGPALSLNSSKSSPPLVVNSSKLVKHLNASAVGGKSAAQLEPTVWRYHLGKDNTAISATANHFFTTKLPTGTYEVTMSGILTSTVSTDQYICAIGDKQRIVANDIGGLFTYALNAYTTPVFSDTYTTKITKNRPVLFGCNLGGTGTVTTAKPVQFTFRAISLKDKKGTHFTIPSPRNAHSGTNLLTR